MSNAEYRIVINFFTREELSATQMTKELADVCGDSTASFRTVAKWVAEFKDPTRVFDDASRSAPPLPQ